MKKNTPNPFTVALRTSAKIVASSHLKRAHTHSTQQHTYTDKHREGDHWVYEYGHDDHKDAVQHHKNQADHHRRQSRKHENTHHGSHQQGHTNLASKHVNLAKAHDEAAAMHKEAAASKGKADDHGAHKGHTMRAQAAEHDVDHHSKELEAAHKSQKEHNKHRDHHTHMADQHGRAARKNRAEGHNDIADRHDALKASHSTIADEHHQGTGSAKKISEEYHAPETDDEWAGDIALGNKRLSEAENNPSSDNKVHKVDTSLRAGGKAKVARGSRETWALTDVRANDVDSVRSALEAAGYVVRPFQHKFHGHYVAMVEVTGDSKGILKVMLPWIRKDQVQKVKGRVEDHFKKVNG